ncbi:hypothetical protein BJY59DRAFT_435718 [Rhodotorula toruloides]
MGVAENLGRDFERAIPTLCNRRPHLRRPLLPLLTALPRLPALRLHPLLFRPVILASMVHPRTRLQLRLDPERVLVRAILACPLEPILTRFARSQGRRLVPLLDHFTAPKFPPRRARPRPLARRIPLVLPLHLRLHPPLDSPVPPSLARTASSVTQVQPLLTSHTPLLALRSSRSNPPHPPPHPPHPSPPHNRPRPNHPARMRNESRVLVVRCGTRLLDRGREEAVGEEVGRVLCRLGNCRDGLMGCLSPSCVA